MLNGEKSDRELERDIKKNKKQKETFFVGKTTRKSWSGDEKIRNASGHQGENERQWKKKQTNKKHNNMYDISSIKRVARNVLEFSLHIVVVQNNGKEMYKKSVLRVQSCFFVN